MKILIGEISSYKAIVIARHIKAQYPEMDIWGYDYLPGLKMVHTRYIDHYIQLTKTHSKERYIQQLSQCVLSIKADKLIPVHSDYIGDILAHKDLFGTTLDYMGNYDLYLQLHEKDRLMSLAKELGVRIPINYNTIEEAQVPFVVKPTDKSSAKGVQYCMRKEDFKYLKKMPNKYICQEYIQGQGCGYEIYCRKGEILFEYGHIRLAEHPISGGSSIWRQGYIHPNMRLEAERILKRIPWTGFAMFEFKVTPSNELILIEVNPRIWGSINQPLEDGVDLFSEVLEQEHQTKPWKGITTCLAPQIYLSLLSYLLHGNAAVLRKYWGNRNNIHHDVSLWNDPKGMCSMLIRKLL